MTPGPTDPNVTDAVFGEMVEALIRDAGKPGFIGQLAVLTVCLLIAWPLARTLVRRLAVGQGAWTEPRRLAAASRARAMFPLLGWVLVSIARLATESFMAVSVLRVATVPLFGISFLYLCFYVLRRILAGSPHLRGLLTLVERVLTALVWAAMVLYVLGILGSVVAWMEAVHIPVGKQQISLASSLMAVVWILLTVLAAMWFGTWLESRLMESTSIDNNLKMVLSRLSKAVLLVASLLLSLSLVGIDLTVLSVFGGALGVGLGFGMQKIASNYIAGFILLLDHSIKLGDLITVENNTGLVVQIRTRHTVVHNIDGETLVPNEQLVSQSVQNHSFSHPHIRVTTMVQADYSAEPRTVERLLTACVRDLPRVLAEPPPAVYLTQFADSGIEYELAVYIADPQNGVRAVRSAMNHAIWQVFGDNGISIPYPQREVRVLNEMPPPLRSGSQWEETE